MTICPLKIHNSKVKLFQKLKRNALKCIVLTIFETNKFCVPDKTSIEWICSWIKVNDKDDYLRNTTGESVTELYNYIKNETDYNEDFIWEAILRDYHQSDIVKNMNLTYIMPSKVKYQNTFKSKISFSICASK